jgi:segregation and condensation protein B
MAEQKEYSPTEIRNIVEAALLAAGEPLSLAQLTALFPEEEDAPEPAALSRALEQLETECEDRGIELRKVASGYRLQVKAAYQEWVSRLWSERPKRYTRALLETLALVAYRQPITRGEIEDVRGVSLSSNIIRTLQERDWIRVVGHRDVPGKPALFGTTRAFLDYFNLESLDELPTLAEIKDMETLEPELEFEAVHEDDASASEEEPAREPDDEDVGEAATDEATTRDSNPA